MEEKLKIEALYGFEGVERHLQTRKAERVRPWGCSSDGRAPALHAGGQGFDPPSLHQKKLIFEN